MSENIDHEPANPEMFKIIKDEYNLQYARREGFVPANSKVKEQTKLSDYLETVQQIPPKYLKLEKLQVGVIPSSDVVTKPGIKITEVFFPVTNVGEDLSTLNPEELNSYYQNKNFFQSLRTNPENNFTSNAVCGSGYFYDLLPEEFKKDVKDGGCTFVTIPNEADTPMEYYIWYIQQRNLARENLKKLLQI